MIVLKFSKDLNQMKKANVSNSYYIRIKGTERYLTNNGAFYGYGKYFYATEYSSLPAAKRAMERRQAFLSQNAEFEIVNSLTLECA
jgi:hypothetical protein